MCLRSHDRMMIQRCLRRIHIDPWDPRSHRTHDDRMIEHAKTWRRTRDESRNTEGLWTVTSFAGFDMILV
jgi:hypothetical protein